MRTCPVRERFEENYDVNENVSVLMSREYEQEERIRGSERPFFIIGHISY